MRVVCLIIMLALTGGYKPGPPLPALADASQEPIACQAQDIAPMATRSADMASLKALVARLHRNLRRMHCTAQQLLEEPTLEGRMPYEERRQDATRTTEDLVSKLQLSMTAEQAPVIEAVASAFFTFRTLNATLASEALLAETPDETAVVQKRLEEQGQPAFDKLVATLKPLVALQSALTVPVNADDGWEIGTLEQAGFNPTALDALTQSLRRGDYGNIHAVVVAHDGKLVYETYLAGLDKQLGMPLEWAFFSRESQHDLRSITKSVTSAVLGAALGSEFEAALDQPILAFFPEYANIAGAGVEAITLRHVLTMSAGLEWNEMDVPRGDRRNDESRQARAADPLAFVLSRPVRDTPGERWYYSGGLTEIIAGVIRKFTDRPLAKYVQQRLFGPLGITDFTWIGPSAWRDADPDLVSAAWGLRLRARDLAKIGQVFLNGGTWKGRQILLRDWVAVSTQRHLEVRPSWSRGGVYGYGFQWWHANVKGDEGIYTVFAGSGKGGQKVFIVPQHRLVVTIFAWNLGSYRGVGHNILREIVAAKR